MPAAVPTSLHAELIRILACFDPFSVEGSDFVYVAAQIEGEGMGDVVGVWAMPAADDPVQCSPGIRWRDFSDWGADANLSFDDAAVDAAESGVR